MPYERTLSPVSSPRELLIYLLCLLLRVSHVAPNLFGREAHRYGERVDGDAKDRNDYYVLAERDDPPRLLRRSRGRTSPRGPIWSVPCRSDSWVLALWVYSGYRNQRQIKVTHLIQDAMQCSLIHDLSREHGLSVLEVGYL
jgi:hypothetical protein